MQGYNCCLGRALFFSYLNYIYPYIIIMNYFIIFIPAPVHQGSKLMQFSTVLIPYSVSTLCNKSSTYSGHTFDHSGSLWSDAVCLGNPSPKSIYMHCVDAIFGHPHDQRHQSHDQHNKNVPRVKTISTCKRDKLVAFEYYEAPCAKRTHDLHLLL